MVWSHAFKTPEQNMELVCYQSLSLSPKFPRYVLVRVIALSHIPEESLQPVRVACRYEAE